MMSGFEGYIAFIAEDKQSKPIDEIPVVCEFPDVFPNDIPVLPPVCEIDFMIELYYQVLHRFRRLRTEWPLQS